jgi:glycosyltransferase involved in cell wall biosynthesis
MKSMKISVIIPTFRRPHLLQNCLSSLVKQSFPKTDFEVIVVSDGPDETANNIVSTFSFMNEHFVYLQMPQKKGPAAARNFGWRRANGVLIAFTDDDTLSDTDWLKNLWKAYKGEKEIAYAGKIKVPLPHPPTDYEKNTAGLETAAFVTANCCCSKAALQTVDGFDERFSMAWREDSDLEFKLLLHKIPIVRVVDALVVHPVRQAPWGISLKEQKKGMFNALLFKKHPGLYRQKIQPGPPWNYYVMVGSFLLLLIGIALKMQWLSLIACGCWLILLVSFIGKRLKHTSKNFMHVMEMIITSVCIPFISVYWQLYGAWRYRVFFF